MEKRLDKLAVQFREAAKKLKDAREVTPVNLSTLTSEELAACKGMWVRWKYAGDTCEGVLLDVGRRVSMVCHPAGGGITLLCNEKVASSILAGGSIKPQLEDSF
ncbi:hypothetical protein [Corynebacterium silvaticum]|uniref:Uncharacterized protein n=1 Tax=Corynebacterium silvaticum TaxID=2320431 RepID=A0A7Y4P8V1_9CORY|nr:hypothetical protein [Corynebacterium silvaticum]ARU45409.1 hypothetical protein CBE74_01605 [Corynebacterium silvaticum]MBH5299980.1 hypothetical protein [Corynebacterium silvaticum]NOM65495.1 hypothetical protein [Corynebacterium silvaticum]NON70652.1 hypothetical protein [Corynebacterium silvaticum]TFA92306.1 hypothetical protein EU802_06455 [Corynebacterium silvaticum]